MSNVEKVFETNEKAFKISEDGKRLLLCLDKNKTVISIPKGD